MIKLNSITLVSVSSVNIRRTIAALKISMQEIEFGRVILVTHRVPKLMDPAIEVVLVPKVASINHYNRFIVYSLGDLIETSHCLLVQADGYVLNPRVWTPEFLNYDYIGAPWPISEGAYIDPFGNHIRVGNGGFSLRSKRLLDVPKKHNVEWDVNGNPFYNHFGYNLNSEDGIICVHNRHVYEAAGCHFAPVDVAARFAVEITHSESFAGRTFGFHKRRPPSGAVKQAPIIRGFSFRSRV
jgi:hypothetical protein